MKPKWNTESTFRPSLTDGDTTPIAVRQGSQCKAVTPEVKLIIYIAAQAQMKIKVLEKVEPNLMCQLQVHLLMFLIASGPATS